MKTTISHWAVSEWVSCVFHTALVAIPLGIATTSQWAMWAALFGTLYWYMPWLLVCAVEIPALFMFGFHVAGVPSRFVWMRHGIPFISGVGLTYELHKMLQGNGEFAAWAVALLVAGIFIYVSFGALTSIEDLFVSPDVAAKRSAERATAYLENTLGELTTRLRMARSALQRYDSEVQALVKVETVPLLPETVVVIGGEKPAITENKTETVKIWLAAGRTPQELCAETGWEIGTIAPLWSKAKKAQEGT